MLEMFWDEECLKFTLLAKSKCTSNYYLYSSCCPTDAKDIFKIFDSGTNITFVIICTPTLKGYFMQQKQWQRFKNCCFFFLKTGSQVDLELKNRHTHAHTQMCTHAYTCAHTAHRRAHTHMHAHTPLFLLTALKSFSLPFIFSLLILYTEMDIFYINSTWSLKISL